MQAIAGSTRRLSLPLHRDLKTHTEDGGRFFVGMVCWMPWSSASGESKEDELTNREPALPRARGRCIHMHDSKAPPSLPFSSLPHLACNLVPAYPSQMLPNMTYLSPWLDSLPSFPVMSGHSLLQCIFFSRFSQRIRKKEKNDSADGTK